MYPPLYTTCLFTVSVKHLYAERIHALYVVRQLTIGTMPFVMMGCTMYESFMEFKEDVTYQNDLRIVEELDLLTYLIKTCK